MLNNINNFNKTNNKYVLSSRIFPKLISCKLWNSLHKTNNSTPSLHCLPNHTSCETLCSYINKIVSLPALLLYCVFDHFVLPQKIPNICCFIHISPCWVRHSSVYQFVFTPNGTTVEPDCYSFECSEPAEGEWARGLQPPPPPILF